MRRACLAQGYPPARLNRRFALSPVDALVDIKIGCGLRRQVPARLDSRPVIHLRITVVPQWWPACRGYCSGACESMPMCSRIFLICTPSAMNAIRRICPPHIGHGSGNTL